MIKDFLREKIDAEDIEAEEQIQEIVESVKEQFQVQCKYFNAGGFDSPGYDVTCYVIAFIDENGILQGRSIEIESC